MRRQVFLGVSRYRFSNIHHDCKTHSLRQSQMTIGNKVIYYENLTVVATLKCNNKSDNAIPLTSTCRFIDHCFFL